MADDADQPYSIGYKHPPRETRFKPGRSGNPKGRPRGARSLTAAVQSELRARITVTENGKRKSITKCDAIAKQLVNKAATGDSRSLAMLLLRESRLSDKALGADMEAFDHPDDAQVLEGIFQRLKLAEGPPSAKDAARNPTNTEASLPGDMVECNE